MMPTDPAIAFPLWKDRFTSQTLFDLEQERLGGAWNFVAFTSDLKNDGDWIRATLGGRSVFVQRFGDVLRGFENICAHRFYPLRTTESGNGPIRCGFHHWQYNSDGFASGIPKCGEMFGVKPGKLGARLTEIDVDVCGCLVFARLRGGRDVGSLQQFLGEGYPIIESLTRGATPKKTAPLSMAANWKFPCEISLDDYHLVAVHPTTFGKGGYLSAKVVQYYRFGDHSAYFYAGEEDSLTRMASECRQGVYEPTGFRTFHIFPNMTILHVPAAGQFNVLIHLNEPTAVDQTTQHTWVVPLPAPAYEFGWAKRSLRRLKHPWIQLGLRYYSDRILNEDKQVCEQLQVAAGHARGRPHFARHEARIAWFEEVLASWLESTPVAASVSDGSTTKQVPD